MSVVDVGLHGANAGQGAAVQRAVISARSRRRLDQEKVKCMQRYEAREQRVLKTLNYCLTALEQLEGWAVFAIFPTDEIQSGDRYFHRKIYIRIKKIQLSVRVTVNDLRCKALLSISSWFRTHLQKQSKQIKIYQELQCSSL